MPCPFRESASPSTPARLTAAAPVAPAVPPPQSPRATPGPTGLISYDPRGDPLGFLGKLIAQHGDVTRYQTRFGTNFLFIHPAHVQAILHNENYRRASLVRMMLGDGLLASDGPRWRSQRRLMQRDFLPARIESFAQVISAESARTAGHWMLSAASPQPLDITAAMTQLTLRIIVQALFSEDLPADRSAELCAAITQTILDLGDISWAVFGAPVQFSPRSQATFAAAKSGIDAACYDMIARRRATAESARPRDLLTLLVEADTETGPLTDLQLRDELVTMLVGGHETTALALAWAWKLLAEHPAAASNLQRELQAVLGNRAATLDDLEHLPVTRATFQEAMRLYPPVWYMARVATQDGQIDGHHIPRGACVMVSAWFTHRHRQFWLDPERFDPARFIAADPRQHRYAYFPFGGGRHQCLGMPLAMMEGTLILAELARQFHVTPVPGQHVKPNPGITLRQSPGLLATVSHRSRPGTVAASDAEAA